MEEAREEKFISDAEHTIWTHDYDWKGEIELFIFTYYFYIQWTPTRLTWAELWLKNRKSVVWVWNVNKDKLPPSQLEINLNDAKASPQVASDCSLQYVSSRGGGVISNNCIYGNWSDLSLPGTGCFFYSHL